MSGILVFNKFQQAETPFNWCETFELLNTLYVCEGGTGKIGPIFSALILVLVFIKILKCA